MGVWEGFPAEELSVTMSDISGYNANNVGVQHITVTKNEMSASFDVEVMALTSIVVDKPPTKTDYTAGQALDLTGIMIYGNYTGASPTKRMTELIPVDMLEVSGYEANRVGNQQRVTVTVRGQTANFFVNIDQATAAAPPPQTMPPQTTPPQAPSTATEAQRVLAQAAYDARLREGGFDPYKPDNPADRIYQAVLNDKTGNPEQAGYDARVAEGGFNISLPDNPAERIYQAVLAAKNGQSTTTPAANPPSSAGR
jgi:hypothetical protein